MSVLAITIEKNSVYSEVAKTTAYIGAKNKQENGKTAFDQMFVTDADLAMIERFYNEGKETLKNLLKQFVTGINDDSSGNINWTLTMSSSFKSYMEEGIISSIKSFLVNYIITKWCEITANDKVKEYAENATVLLQDIKEKVYYKSAPTRTKPSKDNDN